LGANWDNGSRAGGFYWNVSSPSALRDRALGGRLLYVPPTN